MLYRLSYFRELTTTSATVTCIVGADGFEPPKVKTSRFTVCPIWPLWNTPNIYFNVRFGASCRIRTNDPEITNHVLWPTELKRRGFYAFLPRLFYTSAEKRCKGSAFFSTDKIFFKKNAILSSFFIKRGAKPPLSYRKTCYFICLYVFPPVSLSPPNNHLYPLQTYHILFAQKTLRRIPLRAHAFPY